MADVGGTADADLEIARVEMEITQLRHNLAASRFRLLQLDSEKGKIAENMQATETSLTDAEQRLLQLRA